jgi:hypothetical protein
MPPIELAERLTLLLALAVFLGLAFEEIYKRDEPAIPSDIRIFPLVGLAGGMLYLIEPQRDSSCAGPMVRIHLPPARSLMRNHFSGA